MLVGLLGLGVLAVIIARRSSERTETHEAPKDFKTLVKTIDGVKVYRVDGEHVRNEIDVDFSLGGHGYVYDYIPKDEIWVDDVKSQTDFDKIVLHESVERTTMKEKDIDYESAHKMANRVESEARKG